MKPNSAVVIVLGLIVAACGQVAAPPAAHPDNPPSAAQAVAPTQDTPAQAAQATPDAVPQCIFNAPAGQEPVVPPLEVYQFSEPRVILQGKLISIDDWLPDNQRLLVTRQETDTSPLNTQIFDLQSQAIDHMRFATNILGKRCG